MATLTSNTAVASDEEMLRYANAYIATSNALGDAIIILKNLEAQTADADEAISLMNQRRDLEERYARNERNFLAFHAEDIAMHPPTRAQVDAIVNLASQVAQLTLQRADAAMVITLATDIADRFDEIQG
jgi:hypothetical protein